MTMNRWRNPRTQQHFKAVIPDSSREVISCKDAGCLHYLQGWMTIVPTVSDHADYIRHQVKDSGWRFTEAKVENGMSQFVFPPGQRCFRWNTHTQVTGPPVLTHETAGSRHRMEPHQWQDGMNAETFKLGKQAKEG